MGFFFQAEGGKRSLVRSRGLGGVYKGQRFKLVFVVPALGLVAPVPRVPPSKLVIPKPCLLYTFDAADEENSLVFGGSRIFKKKNNSHLLSTNCSSN